MPIAGHFGLLMPAALLVLSIGLSANEKNAFLEDWKAISLLWRSRRESEECGFILFWRRLRDVMADAGRDTEFFRKPALGNITDATGFTLTQWRKY